MAELGARERAKLPDSAFAHVGPRGRRLLPIHDAAHVRNALARFNRTDLGDEGARESARTRLLAAARKHGIVPVGFMAGQMRRLAAETARLQVEVAARTAAANLPTGRITFLFSDVEDSTGIIGRIGEQYAPLIAAVRRIHRTVVASHGGTEVDARADEYFAAFTSVAAAVRAAVDIQRAMAVERWPGSRPARVRIGIHAGEPTVSDGTYVGIDVHVAARVCSAAHGAQIVVSATTARELNRQPASDVGLRDLGSYQLHGLAGPAGLLQVTAADLPGEFPAPRDVRPLVADRTGDA